MVGGRADAVSRVDDAENRAGLANSCFFNSMERVMLQNFPFYAYIPAKDVARARRFYEDKLGFRPKLEVAGGVVYEFGEKTACFLYPTPNAGTSLASQAFWQVDDVEREGAELKGAGGRVVELRHAGREEPERRPPSRRREGGLVQGQRRQHPGHHSERVSDASRRRK